MMRIHAPLLPVGLLVCGLLSDPLFVGARHDDYRLRPESPALRLGFKPIPVEKIGLYKSAERASWPVADDCWREEHILYPERR
jgi:hypothetical protein